MTAIAYRDGILAADTSAWHGNVNVGFAQKIYRFNDGSLFAAQGLSHHIEAYVRWRGRDEGGEKPPSTENDTEFWGLLVSPTEGPHWVDNHYKKCPTEDGEFFALGGAAEFLYGAMAAGATAEEAVTLAIKYHSDAAGNVETASL